MHKNPALDLVGWWSTAPSTGPNDAHLPLHRQILQDYNESAVFLAFHPSQLQGSSSNGGKLPLTVYESVHEGEAAPDASKDMQVDGEEPVVNIRFRELPYSVETGESEMIGIDTIVQASGTASLNATQEPTKRAQQTEQTESNKQSSQVELSQEEEECKFHRLQHNHWIVDTDRLKSNRKPQHSSQCRSHPRIPHFPHQILPLQSLRSRFQLRPIKGRYIRHQAVTPNHPQRQLSPLTPVHPLSIGAKHLHHRSTLAKQ